MAAGYLQVPDWFSFENQGGGVAVADLGGTGQQDLLLLMVDNPPGKNNGFYRVGRNIDALGNPLGGLTPWAGVPDWFSLENQGADIAAADIDKDGKQDLVVFMIDNPPGRKPGILSPGQRIRYQRQCHRWLATLDPNPGLVFLGESTWLDRARRSRRRWQSRTDRFYDRPFRRTAESWSLSNRAQVGRQRRGDWRMDSVDRCSWLVFVGEPGSRDCGR